MMYDKSSRSEERVLGYELREVLTTAAQLDEVRREVEAAIVDHWPVRLLVSIPSVADPDVSGLDDDIGVWPPHSDDVDRYAVVGESPLLEWSSRVADLVASADVRFFEQDRLHDAWACVEMGRGMAGELTARRSNGHRRTRIRGRPHLPDIGRLDRGGR